LGTERFSQRREVSDDMGNPSKLAAVAIFTALFFAASAAWGQDDDSPVISGPDDEAVDADDVDVVDPERSDPIDPDDDESIDPEEGDTPDPDDSEAVDPEGEFVDPDRLDTVDPEEAETVDPDEVDAIDPDRGGPNVDPDTADRQIPQDAAYIRLQNEVQTARELSRDVESRIDELQDRARQLEPGQEALTTTEDVADLRRDVDELTLRFQDLESRLRAVGLNQQARRVEEASENAELLDRRLELLGLSIREREGQRQAVDDAQSSAQTVSQSTASIGPIRPTTRN
jgi:hypothetical protein